MVAGVRIIHAAVGIREIDTRVPLFQSGLTFVRAIFSALERDSFLDTVRVCLGPSNFGLAVLLLLCVAERA